MKQKKWKSLNSEMIVSTNYHNSFISATNVILFLADWTNSLNNHVENIINAKFNYCKFKSVTFFAIIKISQYSGYS